MIEIFMVLIFMPLAALTTPLCVDSQFFFFAVAGQSVKIAKKIASAYHKNSHDKVHMHTPMIDMLVVIGHFYLDGFA